MGVSARAILFHGVIFPEGYEFPWDETNDPDVRYWWLYNVVGYKDPFEVYNDRGEYLPGIERNHVDAFYDAQRAALKENPFPFQFGHAGADGCEYFYIATWELNGEWSGDAIEIPESNGQDDAALEEFCNKYLQPINEFDEAPSFKPQLRLASFLG